MKCCFCGKEAGRWGNNAWPLHDTAKCCDECNMKYVIPARLNPEIKEIVKMVKKVSAS